MLLFLFQVGGRQDMDDVFEETACMKESDGKIQARKKQQAISESKRVARSLNNCQWCLESKEMLKHLIVAIGNQVSCVYNRRLLCTIVYCLLHY